MDTCNLHFYTQRTHRKQACFAPCCICYTGFFFDQFSKITETVFVEAGGVFGFIKIPGPSDVSGYSPVQPRNMGLIFGPALVY